VNPRYLAAPIATALNAAGLALGVAGLIGAGAGAPGFVPYLGFGFVIPLIYLAGIAGAAVVFAGDLPAGARARVPLVLAAMHMAWGAGFLTSPRRLAQRRGTPA
jgi:succinoglycan biosynthesis protein ExoA